MNLATESGAHPDYRKRLLDATEEDTVVTRAFSGRPARALRNRFLEKYSIAGSEPLAWPLQGLAADGIYAASQSANNDHYSPLLAGQGLKMLKGEQGAAEIVEEILERGHGRVVAVAGCDRTNGLVMYRKSFLASAGSVPLYSLLAESDCPKRGPSSV